MKLGCIKPRYGLEHKTDSFPKQKLNSKIQVSRQISQCMLDLKQCTNQPQRSKIIRQIINLCYSNWTNQFYLCNNLKIPFHDGPISITPIPQSFKGKGNQMLSLFKYLQKIKQSYICWLIYNDSDLGILNLKLITQFQLSQLNSQFSFGDALIGIFIGKAFYSKLRTMSTKTVYDKFQCSFGLSTKTTKDSLNDKSKSKNKSQTKSSHSKSQNKSNKSLKSVSMKQKKNLKHDSSQKILNNYVNHHKRSDVSQNIKNDLGAKDKLILTFSSQNSKKIKVTHLNKTGG